MVGNDVVRFCRHCNLSVHDLTLMTRQEALALVRNSGGRLCLRYVRRPDGTIRTASPHQKLHLIKRRVTRIVAGAFGATLSLCAGVAAQTTLPANASEGVGCAAPLKAGCPSSNFEGGVAVLAGTVQDPNKAVIPGASVTLINDTTKNEMVTQTNDEGQYRFSALAGGSYTLIVEAPGFVRLQINQLNVQGVVERTLDLSLYVGVVGGAIAVIGPSEPLVAAVIEDNSDAVIELLADGANVNVVDDNYDSTALAEAVARGNEQMVEILLRARADVDVKNKRGQAAIMYLSARTTNEIVRQLVAAGAQINEPDEEGNTPLLIAAALGTELLRAVIEAGANVNERNEAGQTALMLAAREGYLENVQALLNAGANIYMEDTDGWTALKYAQDNSRFEIAGLLKAHGAIE
jgi:hypothetical protein